MATRTPDRSHLSIGEVLSLLQDEYPDITISKIRFLESQGLLDPERTPSGYRKFYEADIERLRWILHQQKENFLPLKVIKDRLASGDFDNHSDADSADEEEAAEADAEGPEAVQAPVPVDEPVLDLSNLPPPPPPTPFAPPLPSTTAPEPEPTSSSVGVDAEMGTFELDGESTSVSLSADELRAATGLTPSQLAELEGYGVIEARSFGNAVYYDDAAMVIGKLACAFLAHGVDARHLRMYKVAAEREAGFYEALVVPRLAQRRAGARQEALTELNRLVTLGDDLRRALLRRALRDDLRPS